MSSQVTKEQVIDALRDVYDTEIPVNVYDLGLIYAMDIDNENQVSITMTLTAPGCGMGPVIAQDVETKISNLNFVNDILVEVVWEPLWNQEMMSEEAKLKLGMF